ncbi:WD40-repeat-containing domain [Pseudocohnilembus persalinus]|uniref:WD40-repeat-containing domain n=1 Tax=Pseudocohnilembus persalinus TaxID=266149 RepID=A0A0V0QAL5_PSEPJ|nr:WD40-repeat-containing domain [Pseudocohnilembus persalinus]|eukprot:KRW99211.1 WD40-repeat-containing domain [Pseudocohnilembus persalinus]
MQNYQINNKFINKARFEKDRELTQNEILDRAYSRKTKRYIQSQLVDNNTHSNIIKRLIYSPTMDHLICLEQSSNRLKLYSPIDISEPYLYDNQTNQRKKINLQISLEESQRTFIIDFAVAEQVKQIAAITSDRQVFFWETSLSTKILKQFKLDVLLTGIWYLPIHNIWITAGGDYNIRTYNFSLEDNKKKIQHQLLLIAHMKQITDICELQSPKLIASSSLDGKIKLWDINDLSNPVNKTELKDNSNENKRGILGMSYSSNYGSNLLTYGFENHINVWCPQVSITRAFIGKLEGHSTLVVNCKFIPQSPNVISVDDKANIRIWDIRTMNTIQVITSDSNYNLITDIALITGLHDKFVVAGKRQIFYENAAVTKSMKSINEDLTVLQVEFNTYYNYFVVLTKIDVRCYDAMTGKLRKVFNEVHDEKFSVDLCCFCFGGGDRKFYLSDNAGLIRQYNMKNGEFLKNVNSQDEIENSEFSKKQHHLIKKENNEISKIMYNTEEKLLIACYSDSTIRIYDESDAEESILMKVLSGAHRDAEISQIGFSTKQNLLCSGSTNGIIAIWNFETGKCDGLLLSDPQSLYIDNSKNNFEIISLEFADPYPVLVSACINGTIMIWGIGNKAQSYKSKCIMKIHNSYWEGGIYINNQQITSLIVETQDSYPVPYQTISKDDPYRPPYDFQDPIIQNEGSNQKKKNQKREKEKTPSKGSQENDQTQFQINQMTKKQSNIQKNQSNNNNNNARQSVKKTNFVKGQKENYEMFQEYNEQYMKQNDKKKRLYIYYTDVKGYMHCLHLTDVLNNRDIFPNYEHDKSRQSFQLRRKDLINASKMIENLLSSPEKINEDSYVEAHAVNSVLVKRWKAHKEKVNQLTKLNDPICYITCSPDKKVKIWSMKGEQYCQINLVKFNDEKENFWNFPFSWVKQKLKDIDHVFNSLNIIDNEVLTDEQKEDIKKKYLYNKYMNEDIYNDMISELRKIQYPEFEEDDEDEKQKQKQLMFQRMKPLDAKEVINNRISELNEQLEDIERKKINFNFSTEYKNRLIIPTNLYTIKGYGNDKKAIKAAALVYTLDNRKRYEFQFRIRKQVGVVGVGICKRSQLEQNNYQLKNTNLGHGMYVITSEGKSYSNHKEQQNFKDLGFKIKYPDIIKCKLFPFSKELVFQIENSSYETKLDVEYPDPSENNAQEILNTEPYSLVALVSHEDDELEFYGAEVISKKSRINQVYKNIQFENEKMYQQIKQRVGLSERPVTSYQGQLPLNVNKQINKISRPNTEGLPTIQDSDLFEREKKDFKKLKDNLKKKQRGLKLISSSFKRLESFNNQLHPHTSSHSQLQKQSVKLNNFASVQNNNQQQQNYEVGVIKEFDQKSNIKDKYKYQKDIKYKQGEGSRQVRVCSNQYSYGLASRSPNMLFADNEMLTKKYNFYKELMASNKGDRQLGHENFDYDDEDDLFNQQEQQNDIFTRKKPQIVATRNFWNNPVRNKHKIFKTGQKVYVIEQD